MEYEGVLQFSLGKPLLGHSLAYVYILLSKRHHALYVGQTNMRGGVLSRLGGHVDTSGTFRKRLLERLDTHVEDIDDFQVFAFTLPSTAPFVSADETYREGVEYRVQKRLRSVCGDWQPYFYLISNVTAPVTTDLPEVINLADQIFHKLEQLYNA